MKRARAELDEVGLAQRFSASPSQEPAVRDLTFVFVPVDSGAVGVRRGKGPDALATAGLVQRVSRPTDTSVRILPENPWRAELQTTFLLHHQIAAEVQAWTSVGRGTIVLSGDCNATVGVLAGLGRELRTGVIWFDAHGDFNTPETDVSGFLDGQGLAMVTGRCWNAHTSALPGFSPSPDRRVMLVGARDLDPAEGLALDDSEVRRLAVGETGDPAAMAAALDNLCGDVDRLHIHFDADVLDPGTGAANDWAAPHGMTIDQVRAVIDGARTRCPVASATIASWDPGADPSGTVRESLFDIAGILVDAVRG